MKYFPAAPIETLAWAMKWVKLVPVLEYSSNPQCRPSFKLEGFTAAGKTVKCWHIIFKIFY